MPQIVTFDSIATGSTFSFEAEPIKLKRLAPGRSLMRRRRTS